jgi:hypothetical protein
MQEYAKDNLASLSNTVTHATISKRPKTIRSITPIGKINKSPKGSEVATQMTKVRY